MSTALIKYADLDSEEDIPEYARKMRTLPHDEKLEEAYKMRSRGVGFRTIAKTFGVSVKTVEQWLTDRTNEYRDRLERKTGVELAVEILQEYDELKDWFIMQANQCGVIHELRDLFSEVDKATNIPFLDPSERRQYMVAAFNVMKEKTAFLQKSGIVPTQPEQLYHHLIDEKDKEESIGIDDGRDKDAILTDIARLLETGRSA